jgi:indoleamine 2,3-dioxygenase
LIDAKLGFLLPQAKKDDELAAMLPQCLAAGTAREEILRHSQIELCTDNMNEAEREEFFQRYGYWVCAWVHGLGEKHIPASLAVPFSRLAMSLERPPMLAYAGMVLGNWQLIEPEKGFIPENIKLRWKFTDLVDESWFFRVHVAIEAQAREMLHALESVREAIADDKMHSVLVALRTMQAGLVQITKTFHEMPRLCDPDIYYQQIRPLLMSFGADVIFEGVEPNPSPLRGGSGAQSSIVPAMLAGLGIDHAANELTSNLSDMRRYMPKAHRDFINGLHGHPLREYCKARPPLMDAYNHVLRNLITFRRAHLYYARTFIFEKSTNPIGTGGTEYMAFLSKLIDETMNQLL